MIVINIAECPWITRKIFPILHNYQNWLTHYTQEVVPLSCGLIHIKNCHLFIVLKGLNQGPKGPVIFFLNKILAIAFLFFVASSRLSEKFALNHSSAHLSRPRGSREEELCTWAKGKCGRKVWKGVTASIRREEIGKSRKERIRETTQWKGRKWKN